MFLRTPQQALRRRLAGEGGWASLAKPAAAAACAAGSSAAAPSTPDAIAAAAAPPRPPRNLRRLTPEESASGVCSVLLAGRSVWGVGMDSSPPLSMQDTENRFRQDSPPQHHLQRLRLAAPFHRQRRLVAPSLGGHETIQRLLVRHRRAVERDDHVPHLSAGLRGGGPRGDDDDLQRLLPF